MIRVSDAENVERDQDNRWIVDQGNRWDIGQLEERFGVEVPVASSLFGLLPAVGPRDVDGQCAAEINRRLIKGEPRGGRPEVELVTAAMTRVAVVAAKCHVHGEAALAVSCGIMQGTRPVPLITPSRRRTEAEQVEHLLYADLAA